MEGMEDNLPETFSLLDGDYCEDTTEDYSEEYIPYSLRLLMEIEKEKRVNERMKRNEHTDNRL